MMLFAHDLARCVLPSVPERVERLARVGDTTALARVRTPPLRPGRRERELRGLQLREEPDLPRRPLALHERQEAQLDQLRVDRHSTLAALRLDALPVSRPDGDEVHAILTPHV